MTEKAVDMTAERFEALAEAYGADIGRWPESERAAAFAHAAATPEAAQVLAEARALDALLAALPAAAPSPDLQAAILSRAPHRAPLTPVALQRLGLQLGGLLAVLWPQQSAWKPASVFACAAVLGMVLGLNVAGTVLRAATSGTEDVIAYAYPAYDEDQDLP